MKALIVILTRNSKDPKSIALFQKISSAVNENMIRRYTVIMVQHNGNGQTDITDNDIANIGLTYFRGSLLPGSNNMILFALYYYGYYGYDRYWMIEDDVLFAGDWKDFFSLMEKWYYDFITTNIRTYEEDPSWSWWEIKHPENMVCDNLLASFNPVFSLSERALKKMYRYYLSGWMGHHEVLMPTLLYRTGYSIGDMGGRGKFVIPGFEDKFYKGNYWKPEENDTTSFRYRPEFHDISSFSNVLIHPVK